MAAQALDTVAIVLLTSTAQPWNTIRIYTGEWIAAQAMYSVAIVLYVTTMTGVPISLSFNMFRHVLHVVSQQSFVGVTLS
jgi:hypothetical protein